MTYTIEMKRAPDISAEERRRRLWRAYQIILDCAERAEEAADEAKVDGPASSAAGDAAPERSATGV